MGLVSQLIIADAMLAHGWPNKNEFKTNVIIVSPSCLSAQNNIL